MEPPPKSNPDSNAALSIGAGRTIDSSLITFTFVRSSGPGGQNVNKRATKAQLRIPVNDLALPPAAAARFRKIASTAITNDDELLITCDTTRSQARNKQGAIDQLRTLVIQAMVIPKKRKKTKPTRGSIERRIDAKKRRSQTKKRRGSTDQD